MSTTLFDVPNTLRRSVIASHGPGINPKTFRVEGLDAVILWPGHKGPPPVGTAVMLRLTEGGWSYAGGAE